MSDYLTIQAGIPTNPISKLDFRSRFSHTEKQAIYNAATSNVDIRIWLDDLLAASVVDLSHADTIAAVQALETLTLIATGRAAQILAY